MSSLKQNLGAPPRASRMNGGAVIDSWMDGGRIHPNSSSQDQHVTSDTDTESLKNLLTRLPLVLPLGSMYIRTFQQNRILLEQEFQLQMV